mgnify:FL=1
MSFFYLLIPKEYHDILFAIRFFSILLFTIILLGSIYRKKENDFRFYLLSFVIVSFFAVGFYGVDIDYLFTIFFGIKYFIILLILRKDKEIEALDKALKRVFIVLALYYFLNVLS